MLVREKDGYNSNISEVLVNAGVVMQENPAEDHMPYVLPAEQRAAAFVWEPCATSFAEDQEHQNPERERKY